MINNEVENITNNEEDFDCFSERFSCDNIEKSFYFSKDFIDDERAEIINNKEKGKTYGATSPINGEIFNIILQ